MAKRQAPATSDDGSEFLLYQTEDGRSRVQVRMLDETVWLSQRQLSDLFQKDVRTINEHIQNLFEEGELARDAVIRNFRITASDGKAYSVDHYNLDVIISVGYRVRSHRGTQFRQWATQRLREYIVKGFALDDERLKDGRNLGDDYFEELLERVRAIRASERRFYQKITDIYATSVDYDANNSTTIEFFSTVQNKLHWAIHNHTAAELIKLRADAKKPNMGLTTWKHAPSGRIRKADVEVAKNYLTEAELSELNMIVDQYLSFATLQAQRRNPMTMAEWRQKLDAFLRLNDREILQDAGRVSAEVAKACAEQEYSVYTANLRKLEAENPTSDFDKAVENVKRLAAPRDGPNG